MALGLGLVIPFFISLSLSLFTRALIRIWYVMLGLVGVFSLFNYKMGLF